ncbi:MAG TPA: secondary thiamine-phosphate synthase enzyme YjbQ [Gammaproteobacteria bacterium]|nr:secondary thiamine-phosphate synthase enzyme YjbQ [Gammaproteobacteria bacterium]
MFIQESFTIQTPGRGFIDLTSKINQCIAPKNITQGICNVFLHHTSASLILCENFDPTVQKDLEAFMQKLVPDGNPLFQHIEEGPDDMPSHVRSVLTQNSISIPIQQNKCDLGKWQGIYLWEHRLKPHQRRVTVSIISGKF